MEKLLDFFEKHNKCCWIVTLSVIVFWLFFNKIPCLGNLCKDTLMKEAIRGCIFIGGILLLILTSAGSGRKMIRNGMEVRKANFENNYEELLKKGDESISRKVGELKKMSFPDSSSIAKDHNEVIIEIQKNLEEGMIRPKELRRISMWMEEASDLCDVEQADVDVLLNQVSIYISILTLLITIMVFMGIYSGGIVVVIGFAMFIIIIVFICGFDFERKKKEEFNRILRRRKMLLQVAKREVEARLSELAEEEKQKELEEAKKRCEQGVCEDKVLKSTTQIKILEKEILRIDSEKGFKK